MLGKIYNYINNIIRIKSYMSKVWSGGQAMGELRGPPVHVLY